MLVGKLAALLAATSTVVVAQPGVGASHPAMCNLWQETSTGRAATLTFRPVKEARMCVAAPCATDANADVVLGVSCLYSKN